MNIYKQLYLIKKYDALGIELGLASLVTAKDDEIAYLLIDNTAYKTVFVTLKDFIVEKVGFTKIDDYYQFTKTYDDGSSVNFKMPRKLITWAFKLDNNNKPQLVGMLLNRDTFPIELENYKYIEAKDKLYVRDTAPKLSDFEILKAIVEDSYEYRQVKKAQLETDNFNNLEYKDDIDLDLDDEDYDD